MFTGIIQAVGNVIKYEHHQLIIRTPFRKIQSGESISVDGVCLTVVRKNGFTVTFDVGPETARITTVGRFKRVNLERALAVGDRLGGHWVTGHIDALSRITRIEKEGPNRWMTIEIPRALNRYVVPKGSLAVDGISLTIAHIKENKLIFMIIPHTLEGTSLQDKQAGDLVNIEVDILAKYIQKS